MCCSTLAVRIGLVGSIFATQFAGAAAVEAVAPVRANQLAGLVTAILALVFLTIGVVCVCNCYALLRPESVRSKSRDLLAAPGKVFAFGILATVVAALYFGIVSSMPKVLAEWGGMVGIVVCAAMILTGLCGVFHALGNRVLNSLASEKASYDLWRVTAGAVLIMGCNFFPIAGQIITAVALICAFGVSAHQILRKKPKSQPQTESGPGTAIQQSPSLSTE